MTVRREVFRRALHRQLAVAQHVGPVGDLEREVDVLLDEQDAGTGVVGDLAQHGEQPFDDDRRQAEAHLVDHQQLGLRGQRPRHRQHLLLAARQQPGLTIEETLEGREVPERRLEIG